MSGAHDAVDLAVMFANGIPVDVVETGLARLLKHGVIESGKEGFFMPKFLEAQEASSSDAQRQRESREKRLAKNRVTPCDVQSHEAGVLSPDVTFSHTVSQPVTPCHNLSQVVTPSVPSVPNRTEPSSSFPDDAGASPEPMTIEVVKEKKPKAEKPEAISTATWIAYSDAYYHRHGQYPVRDKIANTHCKRLVEAAGAEEAPFIAAWYLKSMDYIYANAKHPLNLLIRDWQKFRTEMLQGTIGTSTKSRQDDAAFNRLSAIAEAGMESENEKRINGGTDDNGGTLLLGSFKTGLESDN
jgi:hypothetical protein